VESLSVAEQERVIGRLKSDSTELDDKPDDSHVASTDQDRFGKIFRRNMPYGTVTNHGTMFVGFSADQRRLSAMFESMAGLANRPRDALTYYTRPLTVRTTSCRPRTRCDGSSPTRTARAPAVDRDQKSLNAAHPDWRLSRRRRLRWNIILCAACHGDDRLSQTKQRSNGRPARRHARRREPETRFPAHVRQHDTCLVARRQSNRFFSILDKNREHTFVDVVDRNGRGLRLLTPRSWLEDCSWPVWTSDSSTVAFTRNVECDGDIGIYTVRADGTRLRAFFDPIGSDPAWSPDGRTVSYLGGGSALTTLRLMDIDGSKLANTSMDPSWSPDGKWIAFDGTPKGTGGQIWIVNPDGHNLRDLSNDANLPDVNFPPGLDGGGFQCD
jgi:hypothetical protein